MPCYFIYIPENLSLRLRIPQNIYLQIFTEKISLSAKGLCKSHENRKMSYTQDNKLIAIETPLGKDVLLLSGFHGTEGLSILFGFELDMLSENHRINFKDIIGKTVTVSIVLGSGEKRYFNGIISRFSQGRGGGEEGIGPIFSHYTATMVPSFWLLKKTASSRIFSNLSVPEIVDKIIGEKNYLYHEFRLKDYNAYAKRVHCVQYQETDFNFICRLLEEEGIYYFFEHENNKHTLILADDPEKHKLCPNQNTAKYQISAGGWLEEDTISSLERTQQITTGKYFMKDFNYENPTAPLEVETTTSEKALGTVELEIYEYPGGYGEYEKGDKLADKRMQEIESEITTINGSSNCRAFTSGYRFELKDYYRSDMNGKAYVLKSLTHSAKQKYTSGEEISDFSYNNNFTCIPSEVPYIPPRKTQKPVIKGVQTAIVVGSSDEEISTDDKCYGLVKVHFHWDKEDKKWEERSCWIRVSQLFTGIGWGAKYIPRIGQEVIVNFLEGNPDKPIIIGQVYNWENTPPYTNPEEKTIFTVKSYSSKGGDGFNEIRFQDKKGEEQIFIHAEHNYDFRCKNNVYELIENERHLNVKKDNFVTIENTNQQTVNMDHIEKIGKDRHVKVDGKEVIEIVGSHSFTVTGDVIEEFNANHSEKVASDYFLQAQNIVIQATGNITLKVGSSYIAIESGGITIESSGTLEVKGSQVKIN